MMVAELVEENKLNDTNYLVKDSHWNISLQRSGSLINPQYLGIVLRLFGIIVFMSTLFTTKLLFDISSNTYIHKQMDGLINIFSNKADRIVGFIISNSRYRVDVNKKDRHTTFLVDATYEF
jgi:hypothetical protein